MKSDRIKEIQETTAYPQSVSVMVALNQVWNECEQKKKQLKTRINELESEKSTELEIEMDDIYGIDIPIEITRTKCCNISVNNDINFCPNCGRKIIKN